MEPRTLPEPGAAFHAATREELGHLRDSLPRPLVFTYGAFDLLHAGHVVCLEEARKRGRSVVVGMYGDAAARWLTQGHGRPLHAAAHRARVVTALAAVSAVVLFEERRPLALMCALRPDVHVRGLECDVAQWAESELMAEWGGCTVTLPRHADLSTTSLIARMRWARSS
jgi:rfaE bifunctional protein nucleotidyltransferase chain/domain